MSLAHEAAFLNKISYLSKRKHCFQLLPSLSIWIWSYGLPHLKLKRIHCALKKLVLDPSKDNVHFNDHTKIIPNPNLTAFTKHKSHMLEETILTPLILPPQTTTMWSATKVCILTTSFLPRCYHPMPSVCLHAQNIITIPQQSLIKIPDLIPKPPTWIREQTLSHATNRYLNSSFITPTRTSSKPFLTYQPQT